MDELIKRFKTKAGLARAMQVSGPAVHRAIKKGRIPSTWVPQLISQGLSREQIMSLPIAKNAADILSALPLKG